MSGRKEQAYRGGEFKLKLPIIGLVSQFECDSALQQKLQRERFLKTLVLGSKMYLLSIYSGFRSPVKNILHS